MRHLMSPLDLTVEELDKLLDLANDTAVTIKRKGSIIAEDQRVIRRSYNDTWDNYISKYVIEEDRAALRDAVLVEKVKAALEKSDEYSCSYRVIADEAGIHYYQASFIRFYSHHKSNSHFLYRSIYEKSFLLPSCFPPVLTLYNYYIKN